MKQDKITLAHGDGGKLSRELVEEIIYPIFTNNSGHPLNDAAVIKIEDANIAITTDSFVVSPIFFPGGDIGKLAACGTINDLAVSGAVPKYLSVGLIIEEGFLLEDLKKILRSLAHTAVEAGVSVVTGDTKVVEKGNVDKIYINTTGVGIINKGISLDPSKIAVGDTIIISGTVGDHGMAILSKREGLAFGTEILSDCVPLNGLAGLLSASGGVSCMRDPTRGGLAAVLIELAAQSQTALEISEEAIPLHPAVRASCEMLGLDPLYLVNEGKIVIFAKQGREDEIMNILKKHPLGNDAKVIGKVFGKSNNGTVLLGTSLGAKRILSLFEGEHLPRIC